VKATSADVPKLKAFLLQAWKEAGIGALGFTGASDETIREVASEKFLNERISNPDVDISIVEDGGEILGFAATKRIDQSIIELSGIIVLESATGKGIGTALFGKIVSSASQLGFRKMIVKTEVHNQRAIRFYKKMGLREVGRATENVEGKPVDVLVLEKALGSDTKQQRENTTDQQESPQPDFS
jgi:ribosomal protein S18 acetylase RimI-like enzyme